MCWTCSVTPSCSASPRTGSRRRRPPNLWALPPSLQAATAPAPPTLADQEAPPPRRPIRRPPPGPLCPGPGPGPRHVAPWARSRRGTVSGSSATTRTPFTRRHQQVGGQGPGHLLTCRSGKLNRPIRQTNQRKWATDEQPPGEGKARWRVRRWCGVVESAATPGEGEGGILPWSTE